VPKKSKPAKRPHGGRAQIGGCPQGPIYKQKPPSGRAVLPRRPNKKADQQVSPTSKNDFVQATAVPAAPFELREDGSIIPGTPHPDPLPAGEGIINPARRKSEAVSIQQTAAKISPSERAGVRADTVAVRKDFLRLCSP